MSFLDPPPKVTITGTGVFVNVADFLPGAASHSAALGSALAAAGAGGVAWIPAGVTLTLTSTVTLHGRTIAGAGTLARASGSTVLVNMLGVRPCLSGVTLRADVATIVNFSGTSTGPTIESCDIGGATTGTPIGINLNVAGISGVRIRGNTISQASYGVLANTTASDLTDVTITDNRIVDNISSDAIELNAAGHGVRITGNHLSVAAGSGSTSGFGVGMANVRHVIVSQNTFGPCRGKGVHIEDDSEHILVAGNTFETPGHGIWAIDGQYLTIVDNLIDGATQSGITILQDSTHRPANYTVRGNTIRGAVGAGISVNADVAQNAVISENVITACGGDGILYRGTSGGVLYGSTIIESNVVTACGGYGISVNAHIGARISGNITAGNALGGFTRVTGESPAALPVQSPTGEGSATVTAGITDWADLFPAGIRAQGTFTLTAILASTPTSRSQGLYAVSWDGTTLTATVVGSAASAGGLSGLETRVASGMLQARVSATGVDGATVRLWGQLNGTVLL